MYIYIYIYIYICVYIYIYIYIRLYYDLQSLQLSDNIYNIEWTMLNNNVKKGLLMIMNRATIPIEFTSAHIISMNLESFVMVCIRKSYSM